MGIVAGGAIAFCNWFVFDGCSSNLGLNSVMTGITRLSNLNYQGKGIVRGMRGMTGETLAAGKGSMFIQLFRRGHKGLMTRLA